MKSYRYCVPTEIVFENGAAGNLPAICKPFGKKPLVVTGKHSARATGLLDRLCRQFPESVVFDAVEENPSTTTCEAGAALCREQACDMVIGAGGGSPMDAAKAIAVLAPNPMSCEDCFGRDSFENGVLPILALPTTAGTGSEVTPYSVLVNPERNTKRTLRGRDLFPRWAVLDPELTVSLSPEMTAASGFDALSQAMEGFLSKKSTPLGDALALETCRVVRAWLPKAVAEPVNLEARAQMLQAAMLSGCVIAQSGTTLVHAMGYYFTLGHGLSHGLANALLLAPVFRWNAGCSPERVAELAAALGAPAEATESAAAQAITKALHDLLQAAGLSSAARDYGVAEEQLAHWSTHLAKDTARFRNQVGEFTEADLLRIFREAWQGK